MKKITLTNTITISLSDRIIEILKEFREVKKYTLQHPYLTEEKFNKYFKEIKELDEFIGKR